MKVSLLQLTSRDEWDLLWRELGEFNSELCPILFYDGSLNEHKKSVEAVVAAAREEKAFTKYCLFDTVKLGDLYRTVRQELSENIILPTLLIIGGERRVLFSLSGDEIAVEKIRQLILKDSLSVDDIHFPLSLVSGDLPPVEVVIRELIQNSADACERMLRHNPSSKPSIQVDIKFGSDGACRLRISDTGDGICYNTLINKLLRLGSSLTAEYRKKYPSQKWRGMFGYGFVTCLSIADCVEVQSQSMDRNKEGVTWMWNRSGTGFTLLSHPSAKNGTSITLTLRPSVSEKLNSEELQKIIKRQTRYVSIPIYWGESANHCNYLHPPWTSVSPNYDDLIKVCYERGEMNPLHVIPLLPGIEMPFQGLLYIPSQHKETSFLDSERSAEFVDLYVKGIFVCKLDQDFLGPYNGLVGGILCSDDLTPNFMRNMVIKDNTFETHRDLFRGFLEEKIASAFSKEFGLYQKMLEAFPRKMEELLLESEKIRKSTGNKNLRITSSGPRSVEQIMTEMFPSSEVVANLPSHKNSLINILLKENAMEFVQIESLGDLKLLAVQLSDYGMKVITGVDAMAEYIMNNYSERLPAISGYLRSVELDHCFARYNPPYIPAFILQFESSKILVVNTLCDQIKRLESCSRQPLFKYILTDIIATAILMGSREPELEEKQELLEYKITILDEVLEIA